MCSNSFKITLFLVASFLATSSWGIDTSEEEKLCISIGFKNKSSSFAGCVLELLERKSSSLNLSEDDLTCQKYGFRLGSVESAACKQQIDIARQNSRQQEAQYEEQKRQYEEQMAAYQKRIRQEKNQKALDLSLRLLNGQSPTEAVLSAGTGAPIRPNPPSNTQTLIMPGGRMVNCTTSGNLTQCF